MRKARPLPTHHIHKHTCLFHYQATGRYSPSRASKFLHRLLDSTDPLEGDTYPTTIGAFLFPTHQPPWCATALQPGCSEGNVFLHPSTVAGGFFGEFLVRYSTKATVSTVPCRNQPRDPGQGSGMSGQAARWIETLSSST